MITIPSNIEDLKSYKPGKPITQIVEELGLTETAVLWNNENNFGPSPKAMESLRKTMDNSHLYPDPACLALRGKIAERFNVEIENVAVGNGSESIFNNLFNAFFKEGEELLTCEGTFVAVYIWAKANNVNVRKVPLKEGYQFDLNALLDSIDTKTKAIYLSNPNNPTGAMIPKDDLEAFMAKVPSDILVIVDEAYFEFARDLSTEYPNSISYHWPNAITLRTFSKAYGIAAIRIGYALAAKRLVEAMMKVKLTFEPSNVAQAAGLGALEDEEYLTKTVHNNTLELSRYYALFDELGINYVKTFGNFVMLDLGNAEKVTEVFEALMKKGVFVRPLTAFGLPHCLRISVGIPRENDLCLKALKEIADEVGF